MAIFPIANGLTYASDGSNASLQFAMKRDSRIDNATTNMVAATMRLA